MIINTAGEYTLQYTATDACGNSTTVERDLVVDTPPRTVLYTDGTFIINELGQDQATNTALHGQPTNIYIPFDPNGATDAEKYIFVGGSNRPWSNERESIQRVEIGSEIHPTSTERWFTGCTHVTSFDLTNLYTENVTTMNSMFYNCKMLTSIDVSNFDTSNVTNMKDMFRYCIALTSLDLSSFNTSKVTTMEEMIDACSALTSLDLSSFNTSLVTNMSSMIRNCSQLVTIYASSLFVVSQVTSSIQMFFNSIAIVGGAGTAWNANNPTDKTYARIDNPPSAPGYFTAKS